MLATFLPCFRPDARGRWRGPASYRGGDNPTALVIDLDRGVWFDHVTGEGGDIVDFVKICLNTNFKGACLAIEKIVGRKLLGSHGSRPRYCETDLSEGELFCLGFRWYLERCLEFLKQCLDEDLLIEANQHCIGGLTRLLDQTSRWAPYEATEIVREVRQSQPELAAKCIGEARALQLRLAAAICNAAATEAAA